ncbi:CAAX prenyl protease 1 homolog [Diaphorina citri]|uniref:CAAX prenyl protease 1 homolog n=1 Tax=Diaphorina citri TaxID=121845 RepID=A0A3Q0J2T7_DIACI|nr:CAAX prenyl protease 1 homolog [Diaphorina citri]
MFFALFTNDLYIASHLVQWFIGALQIYIGWREYRFIGNVKERPVPVQKYMKVETFNTLKSLNQRKLFAEIANESFGLFIQIVFSDELSHIALWNLSTTLSGGVSERWTTWVFISVITSKDFLLTLPGNFYVRLKLKEQSLFSTIQLLFLEFIAEQVFQLLLLNSLVNMCNLVVNVSKSSLIYTNFVLILFLALAREFIMDPLFDGHITPLQDTRITKELQPYLKIMEFPEGRIYLLKMSNQEDMPNAFTVGNRFFNTQKIIIADNVIGKNKQLNDCCTYKECVAVILHELGHVYYNHTIKSALLEVFITLSTIISFILLHEDFVFTSFGFVQTRPVKAFNFQSSLELDATKVKPDSKRDTRDDAN